MLSPPGQAVYGGFCEVRSQPSAQVRTHHSTTERCGQSRRRRYDDVPNTQQETSRWQVGAGAERGGYRTGFHGCRSQDAAPGQDCVLHSSASRGRSCSSQFLSFSLCPLEPWQTTRRVLLPPPHDCVHCKNKAPFKPFPLHLLTVHSNWPVQSPFLYIFLYSRCFSQKCEADGTEIWLQRNQLGIRTAELSIQ